MILDNETMELIKDACVVQCFKTLCREDDGSLSYNYENFFLPLDEDFLNILTTIGIDILAKYNKTVDDENISLLKFDD